MTIDNMKFDIALANSGLTLAQAAERAGISRQRYHVILNQKNVDGALPWNKSEGLREWTNIDSEYLIFYMETYYLLNSDKKILAALEMTADTNKFNPFVDMLNETVWDGVPRIENLLTDYLGIAKSAVYLIIVTFVSASLPVSFP